MTQQPVHWHEGMFLRPQHFQAANQHLHQLLYRSIAWDTSYSWGVRAVEVDEDALANYRLIVRVLKVRLHEGTLVSIPEDGVLPAYDLKDAFGRENAATVYMGLPLLQTSRANAAPKGEGASTRYLVDTQELEDENTGTNPQIVEIRRYNFRLLFSGQDHSGYEVLPILRIKRADRAEAVPQLDESYIPPLLGCDAWKPLMTDILQHTYDRLGRKIELLSSQIVSGAKTFDSQGQGDRLIFEQLAVMNEAYALFHVLAFCRGVHPLSMFAELCRLVGQLAIFSPSRRLPKLPEYNHDDLGTCFWRVKEHIEALLDSVVEPEYEERPFVGAGLRMQVALEPSWLESQWRMFIGVQSSLPAEQCQSLLTGGLDMKVGSSDRVDEIFRLGQAGLQFHYVNHPPNALPGQAGLIYFELDRKSRNVEWQHVKRSLALAIRLNENLIVSNIQDQRAITITVGGQSTTMRFTLYLVAEKKIREP